MAEVRFIKMPGGMLRPCNQEDSEAMQKIENGALLVGNFKQPRNPKLHRLFFQMISFTYELWEPDLTAFKGKTVTKNFDRFRKDILILSGFRTMVVNVKGEVRYEAESISFAHMDDIQFQEVYKLVFETCWKMVLEKVKGMTREYADNVINQMASFD